MQPSLAEPLQQLCDELSAFHFEPVPTPRPWQKVAGDMREGKKLTKSPTTTPTPSSASIPRPAVEPLRQPKIHPVHIKDMSESQSSGLLRLLYEHMASPQFVVRYHWKPRTLAFWDNRATMHFGIFDYEGERRIMHRVTLRVRSRWGPLTDPAGGSPISSGSPSGNRRWVQPLDGGS